MSGFNHKKRLRVTIVYGILIIAVLLTLAFAVYLAVIFQGTRTNTVGNRQAAAAAVPVEERNRWEQIGEDEYLLSESNSRYLNEYDIMGWRAEDIRVAKNEIYARHGRIFEDESLDSYFRSKNWYVPSVAAQDFTTEVFNEYEKKNVEYLADAQTGKNGSTSDTFTYQDSVGATSFAFKYPVNWASRVIFRVSIVDSGMVISCVDSLNNKRGLSLYGDDFGTVFSLEVRESEKKTQSMESLLVKENGLYIYLRLPDEDSCLKSEPECVKSYENLKKEMDGVIRTVRILE